MRKILSALILFAISVFSLHAQTIRVIDQQTGKPIANVAIYNTSKSHSVLSNESGQAKLDFFVRNDTLTFQHSSFYSKTFSFDQLAAQHFIVKLNERFINLNEVYVSANKWEEQRSEIPNHIETIKSKTILLNNPATSADLIADGQQVFVQKSQLGGGSPMIRGFAANSILLVVDGVRMNNAIYRSGNLQNILQADVNSIKSAEIIFGPGTNIYGSDALGGVVDVHLIDPYMNISKDWAVHGNAFTRFGTAAFERTLHADINISNNKWAFLSSISYTKFGDLRMGTHGNMNFKRYNYVERINGTDSIVNNPDPYRQVKSGYDQINFMQKIKVNLSEKSQLNAGVYYSATSDVPRYDRLTETSSGLLKYAQWYYSPQTWFMAKTAISLYKNNRLWNEAVLTLSYQNVQEGRNDRKFRNDWIRKRKEEVNILGINADFNKKLANEQFLFYGFDLDYNHVASTGTTENIVTNISEPTSTRYPDGGTNTLNSGIYLTYKKNLTQLPVTFLTGLRFSTVAIHSKFIDTSYYRLPYTSINISNQAFTGSIGIIYHPESWQIRLNLSSGFRAPNLDDVAKIFDSEPGSVVVPNENLKPEYVYNAGLGIRKGIGNIADIEVSVFYSYLKNAMVRRNFTLNGQDSIYYDGTLSRVQAVVNTGYAQIYGASFEGEVQISKNWGIKSNLTIIKGKDDQGSVLSHIPPIYGGGTLYFEKNKLRMMFNITYNGLLAYDELSPSEQDKTQMYTPDINGNPYVPAWTTYNLKGTYAFNEHFMLNFAIENLTNLSYRPYASGINAPGINFVSGLRLSF
ncbi:MAG: TonB-dependent receptor [Bacteroidales bacterium]|nr:TonB-dependent receptor [Bacteroidales bacterium]